ncbi:hypothetical protein EDD85DRAFT_778138 [Armillaria nabsnona]|nr:hypothetical protein EDD85DRAFT_778138 [Armillaria nabsnona]
MDGAILPDNTPPPPFMYPPANKFSPYKNWPAFKLADLIYRRNQMPANQINNLLQIWDTMLLEEQSPPYANVNDLYETIDATTLRTVSWECFSVSYNGPDKDDAPWKTATYDVWFRDPQAILHSQLANPDFANEMDFTPKWVKDNHEKHCYQDFMSGNWAW